MDMCISQSVTQMTLASNKYRHILPHVLTASRPTKLIGCIRIACRPILTIKIRPVPMLLSGMPNPGTWCSLVSATMWNNVTISPPELVHTDEPCEHAAAVASSASLLFSLISDAVATYEPTSIWSSFTVQSITTYRIERVKLDAVSAPESVFAAVAMAAGHREHPIVYHLCL